LAGVVAVVVVVCAAAGAVVAGGGDELDDCEPQPAAIAAAAIAARSPSFFIKSSWRFIGLATEDGAKPRKLPQRILGPCTSRS
jgi:hypothetical protein